MAGKLWEVIGGASTGGILVRVGRPLNSAEVAKRLQVNSVIRQIELKGERLHYELVKGTGPAEGWVSLSLKGKSLVVEKTDPKKLLLLSIPWKGHIVHLKRIAAWFSGRSNYEVHFGVFPQSRAYVPEGIIAHEAVGDELLADDMYNAMEDSFRELAKSGKSHAEGVGNMMGSQMKVCAEFSVKNKEPFAQYFKFCIRLMEEVKPDVVVGDGACTFFNILASYCTIQGIRFVWVLSPGIREVQAEAATEKLGLPGTGPSSTEGALSTLADKMGVELSVLAQAMGIPLKIMEAMDRGEDKSMEPGIKLTFLGLLQTCTTSPQAAPFLAKPLSMHLGLDSKRMLQVLKVLGSPAPQLFFLPSARALVGQDARAGDLFTGSFLPLPKREGDKLQWDKDTFESSVTTLKPDLLEWLYNEEENDPVIYIAFGTIVEPSKDLLNRLVEALQGQNLRVLWVLPEHLQQALPKDLPKGRWKILSFAPQVDVLKCDRVVAFMSHMGANSTMESLALGVPMICCPFYLDQYEWAHVVCNYWKAGIQVDRCGDADHFQSAIRQVIKDPKYAKAAAQASTATYASSEATLRELAKVQDNVDFPAELGAGVSVAAVVIIRLMEGLSVDPISDLLDRVRRETPGPQEE